MLAMTNRWSLGRWIRCSLPALACVVSTCLTVGAAAAADATGGKLNVLFLVSDDMRPQLGCYGDALAKSPCLDKLAVRGMVFTRAYCQQALCSPSRISLLSGRRPATSGIYAIGPTLRSHVPDAITLPQHFKNNGYFARSLGKVFHIGMQLFPLFPLKKRRCIPFIKINNFLLKNMNP